MWVKDNDSFSLISSEWEVITNDQYCFFLPFWLSVACYSKMYELCWKTSIFKISTIHGHVCTHVMKRYICAFYVMRVYVSMNRLNRIGLKLLQLAKVSKIIDHLVNNIFRIQFWKIDVFEEPTSSKCIYEFEGWIQNILWTIPPNMEELHLSLYLKRLTTTQTIKRRQQNFLNLGTSTRERKVSIFLRILLSHGQPLPLTLTQLWRPRTLFVLKIPMHLLLMKPIWAFRTQHALKISLHPLQIMVHPSVNEAHTTLQRIQEIWMIRKNRTSNKVYLNAAKPIKPFYSQLQFVQKQRFSKLANFWLKTGKMTKWIVFIIYVPFWRDHWPLSFSYFAYCGFLFYLQTG